MKKIIATIIVLLALGAPAFAQVASETVLVSPSMEPSLTAAPAPSAAPVTPPTIVDELKELQARYQALKGNQDKSAKMLLIAGLLAAGLKLLLSAVNLLAGKKPTKWLAWIALFLALPIALLSHYAGGHSVFDSLVYAGAGPGAIVIHELLKLFAKPKAEA